MTVFCWVLLVGLLELELFSRGFEVVVELSCGFEVLDFSVLEFDGPLLVLAGSVEGDLVDMESFWGLNCGGGMLLCCFLLRFWGLCCVLIYEVMREDGMVGGRGVVLYRL